MSTAEVSERGLAGQEEALSNLRHKLKDLRESYHIKRQALEEEIESKTVELAQRHSSQK